MEVPRDQRPLKDDRGLLSPPIVVERLYGCTKLINVRGFVLNAALDVEVAGATVVTNFPGGFPEPWGAVVPLPAALVPGQVVRARQKLGPGRSNWSAPVAVRDHTQDYPAGPPRPEINPAPVYQCGARTGVANLLIGSDVWITADGAEVGRVGGAIEHQGVNVTPDYGPGQHVVAWSDLCGDPSPPSAEQISQPPPLPLPQPTFQTPIEGSQQVTLDGLTNGARFDLSRNGASQGTYRAWGGRFTVTGISPPVAAGNVFSATQRLCPSDPPSAPGTTTAQPCSALKAPIATPVQVGDTSITLLDYVLDARIQVYVNLAKIGDGSGPVVPLTQAIRPGDTIDILQSLDTCVSEWLQEVHPQCSAPSLGSDPSALDLFPVGSLEYDGGTTDIFGGTYHVRGSVYYPAVADGVGTAFNARLAAVGRVPLVFLVHGNHDSSVPNYRGYDYFQQQLARMGMVVVSTDQNETSHSGGPSNIHTRAQLTIASIAHFQTLDAGGDPIFGGRLDFTRVGLMGHSRGGGAVVLVPEVPPPAGVTIRGVLALAPWDFGAFTGSPHGYPFLTILPAADGDVIDNEGAQFYDRARPDPFRCQLYVDHANHNFFNRQWTNSFTPGGDDTGGVLPIMARADHERILSAYGSAYFRHVLLGHPTLGFLTGVELPANVQTSNVHVSVELGGQLAVDNHEGGNGIGLNSLNQPTAQAGGLTANEYPFKQKVPGRFNDSFFGDTTGMVALSKEAGGTFRSQLAGPTDLTGQEVWIRAAEVYDGKNIPAGPTGFELGLETAPGSVMWVDSDAVGGLPRPFDRRAFDTLTKTMLTTLRFRASCYGSVRQLRSVGAIWLRLNRNDGRALAFDDLEIVKP